MKESGTGYRNPPVRLRSETFDVEELTNDCFTLLS
jgi:hypothetical protein